MILLSADSLSRKHNHLDSLRLLSVIYGFLLRLCDSASCRESQQEVDSYGQSQQEAFYHGLQYQQEATDHRQSLRKSSTIDSLSKKRKLAD